MHHLTLRLRVTGLVFAFFISACASTSSTADKRPHSDLDSLPQNILDSLKATDQLAVHQTDVQRKVSEGFGKKWIVSTQGRAATEAVKEIFHAGGNLLDAAVAASFAIGVERPQSTGIGGGGFLLYREAKTGKVYAIDFREKAPQAAHEKMYLDASGNVIVDKSLVGIYAAGVPGLVKGLAEIHARFGKLPFRRLVEPAAKVAEKGFKVYPYLHEASVEEVKRLTQFPSAGKIFLKNGKTAFGVGDTIIQKDLARTLREIGATKGESFYTGRLAKKIVAESAKLGPWFTLEDFKNYKVRWMEPVRGKFHDYEIISMPPPSSGGAHVIEILNIVENQGLQPLAALSGEAIHKKASAMQFAFIDRARYMGDPAYAKVPTETLTSKKYAEGLAAKIRPDQAMTGGEADKAVPRIEHDETTHFSIMDKEGNVVVSTQTINGWFGSGFVVPGTGILLNNEMDDFSAKPGATNLFGAVGSDANKVEAGKTPLSSMSPTMVLRDGNPVLAIGAPGGTRIITCVAQSILNYLEHGKSLYDSIAMTRFHHQWSPDELVLENGSMGVQAIDQLRSFGYKIRFGKVGCNVMGVSREGDVLHGVSDPRDFGQAYGE